MKEGIFIVGGGCAPSFVQLASYIAGSENTITITPQGFQPKTIHVNQGTTLLWKNTDAISHTITSPYFNATVLPGGLFAYRIRNVGSFLFTDAVTNATAEITSLTVPGSDIMLVIDESGSMKGEPLREAEHAATQFYASLAPGDRAGLITFSQGAHLVQDFTSDRSALFTAVTEMRAEGVTSYLAALSVVESLHPMQHPILIFMSDGVPTDAVSAVELDARMNRLRARGWCVMTVGFGSGGVQARSILARMAGTDACASFLYADIGGLDTAFGTVYQLLAQRSDIIFTHLSSQPIVFGSAATITTRLATRAGALIPGGVGVCAPEATLQASSAVSSTTFTYENGSYYGVVRIPYGTSTVSLVASVSSPEAPAEPFIGRTTVTVIAVPPWIGWSLVIISMALLIARAVHINERRAKRATAVTKKEWR